MLSWVGSGINKKLVTIRIFQSRLKSPSPTYWKFMKFKVKEGKLKISLTQQKEVKEVNFVATNFVIIIRLNFTTNCCCQHVSPFRGKQNSWQCMVFVAQFELPYEARWYTCYTRLHPLHLCYIIEASCTWCCIFLLLHPSIYIHCWM